MKVKIRNTNGSPDTLVETTPDTSMIQLIGDIARQLNIESGRIRLIFNGHLLVANSDNLQRHNIIEGSVLHCVPRPVNVPPSPVPSATASQPRPNFGIQNPTGARRNVEQYDLNMGRTYGERLRNLPVAATSSSSRSIAPNSDGSIEGQTFRYRDGRLVADSNRRESMGPGSSVAYSYDRHRSAYFAGTSATPPSPSSSLVATHMFGREIERAMGNLRSTAESVRRYLPKSLCMYVSPLIPLSYI